MSEEYVHQPYPKWLPDFEVVAQSEAEEKALRDGRAVLHTVKSASGDLNSIVYLPEKPKPEPKAAPAEPPAPEPKTMIERAQETFTRRKKPR